MLKSHMRRLSWHTLTLRPIIRLTRPSSQLAVHRNTAENNPSITFKFDDQHEVDTIISKYPPQYKKAAVIPLLDLAQRQNKNWVSIGVMNEVAKILELNPMRVYEVATFYTMFNRNPIGKYFVQVCTTTPCELCGASDVVKHLEQELGIKVGETTPDKMFTLGEVECAGACVNAPVMSVNDDYYEDLTPASAIEIINQVKAGKAPKAGPQSERSSCEPRGNPTSLLSDPPGPGFKVRTDL